jgi:hypothetical protein
MSTNIDCRTCRHASRDGCHSTVQCVDADQYKPTPTHQFWSRSTDCRTCTYRTWSGSGQSYDCNAAAGMPLPDSHHDGQRPGWCPKEPT